jgi:hypothetical protein
MKPLLRQLAALAAAIAFWHIAVGAASMAVVPPKRIFDSLPASDTIYLTDAKLVAAAVAGMGATASPKLILFGPSASTSAFRPHEVHQRYPAYEVHQLSLGWHNITHAKLEARLMIESLPPEVLAKSVFALAVWYGGFVENGQPHLFDMESVFLQSGLFARQGGVLHPIASPSVLPVLLQLMRPFHFAQWLVESRLGTYRPHGFDRFVNAPAKAGEKEASMKVIEDEWLRRADRTLADQQFDELLEVAKLIDKAGARLLIVDLALPRWHTEHAAYLPSYAAQKEKYWPQLKKYPRVEMIDLTGVEALVDDENYYDLNHVTLEGTAAWADALKARWGPK